MKRKRAGGILIIDNKILLMHRIREINGKMEEYYVIPGGGVEENETFKETAIREVKEEIGIDVKILTDNPLFTVNRETEEHYYYLVEYVSGKIGTGTGPEFTNPDYVKKGSYSPELIDIEDIINGKIYMVPDETRKDFIEYIKKGSS